MSDTSPVITTVDVVEDGVGVPPKMASTRTGLY
jgi:hypothetical protein